MAAIAARCRAEHLRLGHRDVDALRATTVARDTDARRVDDAGTDQLGNRILEASCVVEPNAVLNLTRRPVLRLVDRSEEHTSELQSLMRTPYAVFCMNKQKQHTPE